MQIRDRVKELRKVPARELIANKRNWRRHPKAQADAMREMLADVGFAGAMLARETPAGLELIDGHLRTDLSADSIVPVLVLDVTEAEANKILATFDPISAMADADGAKLAELMEGMDIGDGAIAEMMRGVQDAIPEPEREVLEDEAPEPLPDPVSKTGDLWLLGEHRLLCGDSTKGEDVRRVLGGKKIDICFTSPPYASQRKYDPESGFKPIHPNAYVSWWERVQACVREHLSERGSMFVNIKEAADDGCKQDYVKRLVLKHIDDWGWKWIEEYVWPRPALPLDPNASRRFKNGWESVHHFALTREFVFQPDNVRHESDGCFSYKDQKRAGKKICDGGQGAGGGAMSPVDQFTGLAYPSNVLPNFGGAKVVGHAAAFPVGLPAFFIECFSEKHATVYEPFSGSGSVFIACEQTDRRCVGVELSGQYTDLAVRRWQKLTGREAILDGTKKTWAKVAKERGVTIPSA